MRQSPQKWEAERVSTPVGQSESSEKRSKLKIVGTRLVLLVSRPAIIVPVTPDNSQLKSSQDEATLSANFYAQASLPPSLHVLTLKSLGSKYGTDKVNHGFCDFYDSIFSSTRHRVQKVLEIGVFFGSSLLM